jgi:hypothetical protein
MLAKNISARLYDACERGQHIREHLQGFFLCKGESILEEAAYANRADGVVCFGPCLMQVRTATLSVVQLHHAWPWI